MRLNPRILQMFKLSAAVALAGLAIGCSDDEPTPTNPGAAPTAAFGGAPTSGDIPLTVTFTDQSTGAPTAWSWDFGDGGTSTQQHPVHVFQTAGALDVSLTATNAFGSDAEAKADYITANAIAGPTPVLQDIQPPGASSGLTVTLYGQNFGDGTKKTSAVFFGTAPATSYPSWFDDEIKVVVPILDNPSSTQVGVKVVVDGRESQTVTFYPQKENVIQLTRNTWDDWQPCWGNNSLIFFASFATGNFNIWYIDAGGGDTVQRTFFTEGQTDMPAYKLPNLWYRSNHDGDWDIYKSSGSGNETQLTFTPEKDFEVVVSPDLGPFQIALSKAEEHNGGTIWNIYGHGSTGFVKISDGNSDFHPTFSPNGQEVAYMYKWGDWDPGQIMVVSVHGGEATRITDLTQNCAYPTWNPAFDTVAYTRTDDVGRRNVFMRNPDGTDEVQLTFSEFSIVYPCWSPDGKRLAYAAFFEGNYELYVIDVSGILTAP